MHSKSLITLLALFATLVASAPLRAQGQPTWNRRVEAISVLPAAAGPSGSFDIRAHVKVSAGETTVPLDLSTEIVILVETGTGAGPMATKQRSNCIPPDGIARLRLTQGMCDRSTLARYGAQGTSSGYLSAIASST